MSIAKIFSGVSAGVQGIQSSMNDRFMMDRAIEAIIYSMDTARTIIRTKIFSGMKSDIKDYPLSEGVRDVQKYNEAGSFVVGLTRLSQIAAKDSELNKLDEIAPNPVS